MDTPFVDSYEWPKAHTLPDQVLNWPYKRQIEYIIQRTPIQVLLESQYRDVVHMSPGVHVPKDIANDLSVGMRYMYYKPLNNKLLFNAFHDFQRRLRWRIKFMLEGNNSEYEDRKSTRLNSSHSGESRMPSSA